MSQLTRLHDSWICATNQQKETTMAPLKKKQQWHRMSERRFEEHATKLKGSNLVTAYMKSKQ